MRGVHRLHPLAKTLLHRPLTHVQTMRVILATDDGSTFTVDVDPELQLQDLQALLEAEVRSA